MTNQEEIESVVAVLKDKAIGILWNKAEGWDGTFELDHVVWHISLTREKKNGSEST